MKSRPLCSWGFWTPSSSSHMPWWVGNRICGWRSHDATFSKVSVFYFEAEAQYQVHTFHRKIDQQLSFLFVSVHTGSLFERGDWGQSESALRSLLRPVRLCYSGEYTTPRKYLSSAWRGPLVIIFLLVWSCGFLLMFNVSDVFAGVRVWHSDRMAPHLQHLPVLRPVGAERPAAVRRLALRGGRHGPLVWQDGVCVLLQIDMLSVRARPHVETLANTHTVHPFTAAAQHRHHSDSAAGLYACFCFL